MTNTPYDYLKRAIDIVASAAGLVVLSPVIAVVAVLVRIRLGSPVLFRQQRPGRNGELFELVKFRTMLDGDGDDASRMTDFGSRLRSTSVDELPELMNVLRGDMSLVGPRPLLIAYLDRYTDEQRRRHEVRPGVTGLAQVSGRNALGWEERFALDVQYVDKRSLRLDLTILLKTVQSVFNRSGISAADSVTMHEFFGTEAGPNKIDGVS